MNPETWQSKIEKQQKKLDLREAFPWLDASGKHISSKELERLMPSWSIEVWERYLGSPAREKFLEENRRKKESERKRREDFINNLDEKFVTEKQKKVIYERVVNNKNYTEIGKEMGISRQAVTKLEKKAMANMEKILAQKATSGEKLRP